MEQEFNRNLRRLRRQKGMTQEQLAGAVGVSAQAVSKWEQNGYPDTPLLPAIADSLGVSIDELFGRNQEETPDIFNQLMQYLSSFPYKERLNRAFDLCWAICETGYGMTHYIPLECPENFDASRSDEYKYSETVTEYGFLQAKADPSLQYFLLLPEPESGYDRFLAYDERYVKLFEVLAFPDTLRALYYLAQTHNTQSLSVSPSLLYFTEQTLAHALSIELSHAQEIVEKLLSVSLIERAALDTGEVQKYIYAYAARCNFVSFMTFSHTLLNRPRYYHYHSNNRPLPFFRNETYRNSADAGEKSTL